jgi:hypothetical protein
MLQYDIHWLVEKRVLVYHLNGDYDIDIMRRGAAEIHQHMLSGQHPVHLIIDTTDLTSPSADFRSPMSELQQYSGQEQSGWTVLVAGSTLVRFFGNVAARLLQTPFRIAYSFEEAVTLLRRLEPSLETALYQTNEQISDPPENVKPSRSDSVV